jgi:predicted nuclease of restriction endonuclease-like (RecB) superfamily
VNGKGKLSTNFSRTLPAEDSDLTQQILKDPYSFEFLTLSSSAKERELERGLLKYPGNYMPQLYDLKSDPDELKSVADQQAR